MAKFMKGHSGNPSGRPKDLHHVREMARSHTRMAIHALVRCLRSADGKVVVAAAVALLNRGWGQPQQSVDLTNSDGSFLDAIARAAARPIGGELDDGQRDSPPISH